MANNNNSAASSSDFNLQKVNTKELQELVSSTIEYGGALFVAGRRGSGKTAIQKEAIRKSGFTEVYLNASCLDRCDASGLPKLLTSNDSDEFMKFLLPEYYRALISGNKPCVVLFDEIDKVDHSVVAPLLEFIQLHTINGRPLPNLRATLMTGNLINEGGQRPALPLLDRTEKYIVEASIDHWFDWAASSGAIHPSITAFLNDNNSDLCGEADPGDVYADASPRGWHNASKILFFGEERKWSKDLLKTKINGCVGKKTGMKYSAYFDHYVVLLPYVEDIMHGKLHRDFDKLKPTEQLIVCMMTCSRLSTVIDKKEDLNKNFSVVGKFLQKVDPEMALISIRSQIGVDKLTRPGLKFTDHPEFDAVLENLRKKMFTS